MGADEDLLNLWAGRAPQEAGQWESLIPGPSIGAVAERLSAVPRPFLEPEVVVRALAGDVLWPDSADGMVAATVDHAAVRRGAAIALWLFAAEEAIGSLDPPLARTSAALAVDALALRVASVADPVAWLSDPDRREEAARTFLLWNGQLPAGEDARAAREALAARDSLQFNAALAQTFAEQQHRAVLVRALEDARAREAASRYTRE